MLTTVERSAMTAAVRAATERFRTLVTQLPDPDAAVPHSTWTVREAVTHVATVAPRYSQGAKHRGEWVDDPRDLAALNDRQIKVFGEHDLPGLGSRLCQDVGALLAQLDSYGEDVPGFRFHGGQVIGADRSLGVLLGELLVHGWDLAQVTRAPWPISGPDVERVLRGLDPILPGWLDRKAATGHTASYAVHVRGGTTHVWRFVDGTLTVADPSTPAGRVDVHIGGDPATLLLVLYRRTSPVRAALTGRVLAWGRRPWLSVGLTRLFLEP